MSDLLTKTFHFRFTHFNWRRMWITKILFGPN